MIDLKPCKYCSRFPVMFVSDGNASVMCVNEECIPIRDADNLKKSKERASNKWNIENYNDHF